MFDKLTSVAQSMKEKVADLEKAVEATKLGAAAKLQTGKNTAINAVEEHWPEIEHLLVQGLLTVAEEKLRDDKALESLFGKVYELLPTAVRFVVPRERFQEFSMARRDPLLNKVQLCLTERRAAEGG